MKRTFLSALFALMLALWPRVAVAVDVVSPLDFSSRKACLGSLDYAERHLGNPADPEHDERAFLQVLERVCASPMLNADDKLRAGLLLEQAQKNRVGAAAASFDFVTLEGEAHSLNDYHSQFTLIYFNDPDCDACQRVKARLDTCSVIEHMVHNGGLTVIAVYTLDDEKAWRSTTYPAYMVNGWNKSQSIDNDELYVLPSMPLFYLLDVDKKVVLKNEPSLNVVLETLQQAR